MKFDIKTLLILVLGAVLILVIIFGNVFHKPDTSTYDSEIAKLNQENKVLLRRNDSINVINKKLDDDIASINKQIEDNKAKLANTQLELDKLKKEKNEIPVNVGHLSANGVADDLSKYLQARNKSNR